MFTCAQCRSHARFPLTADTTTSIARYLRLEDVWRASFSCRAAVRPWRVALFREFSRRMQSRLARARLPAVPRELGALVGGCVAQVLLDETWPDSDFDYVAATRDVHGALVDAIMIHNPLLIADREPAAFVGPMREGEREFLELTAYHDGLKTCKLSDLDGNVRVDVITLSQTGLRDKTIEDLLEGFDLTCCQCGWDGAELTIMFPGLLFARRMRVQAGVWRNSARAAARANKYMGRGFKFQ